MNDTTDSSAPMHSPPLGEPKRPRGILKNTNSFQQGSPSLGSHSPTDTAQPISENEAMHVDARRPSLPRGASEKEITHANTLANMGPRRNSSNARSSVSASRRQSNAMDVDENEPRLKWDEANLYLTEQERGHTMKIDEPKTPYVGKYDEAEDEEELAAIDANGVVVDELDKAKNKRPSARRQDSIPDLDLGEPESPTARPESAEKRVMVEPGMEEGTHGHGEEELESQSAEARQKHREFEERRRKHYEMSSVKGMLGHDDEVEEVDGDGNAPPPMPGR